MSMWIITEKGEFLSEVTSWDDSTHRIIRARDEHSIRGVQEFVNTIRDGKGDEVEVLEGAGSDYRYRLTCTDEEWIAFVSNRAETGTGTNHKSAVSSTLGYGHPFVKAMMETWNIWFSYQEDQLPRRKRKW